MNADEQESPKSKPRLNIPAGAMVIIPLRNWVLFPSMIMPLMIRRPARLQAVEETVRQQQPIGFVVQRDPNIEVAQPKDLYEVGTAADVLRMFGPRNPNTSPGRTVSVRSLFKAAADLRSPNSLRPIPS